MDKKIIKKGKGFFSDSEKHWGIREFLATGCGKREICLKYTGKEDHGCLLDWMRELGYATANIVEKRKTMAKTIKARKQATPFETLQLKNQIAELERQLKDAELRAIAFSTMVDIAEKEFKIPIRKKLNTKP